MSETLKDKVRVGSNDAENRTEDRLPLLLPENVTALPWADRREKLRVIEALLFAASEPLDLGTLAFNLPEGDDISALLEELQGLYAGRGVNLVRIAGKWAFRTAEDLSFLLERQAVEQRRLSRAALETLAIIAYHQPVTRADIEEIRGVGISKGTLDVLLETGWVRMRGRRRAPGGPITYGTTPDFLDHFNFEEIADLPGLDELEAAGMLDNRLPASFSVPLPDDSAEPKDDEDPLEQIYEEPLEPLGRDDDDGFEPDSGASDDRSAL